MTHTQTTCPNRIALRASKKGMRPAGVGALAPVFEKSATKLRQQKLLKCKHTVQIATFNVRTLNRIGQLQELTASAIEHKINMICIQEHWYTPSEDIKYHDTDNGWTLATASTWKNSINSTLNGIEKRHPRMLVAAFNGYPRGSILPCYSPTNISEETKLIAFYDKLSSLVCSNPKHNVLFIGGDIIAKIGKNGNHKYSLHNSSSRNGQQITDFTIENRFIIIIMSCR